MDLFKRFGDKRRGNFHRGIDRYGDKKHQAVNEPVELNDEPEVKAPTKRRGRPSKNTK